MLDAIGEMFDYLARVAPGIVVIAAFLVAVPRTWRALRVIAYILAFILIRDAMTPLGFWSFGSDATFWIRFAPKAELLVLLGLGSLLMVFAMLAIHYRFIPIELRGGTVALSLLLPLLVVSLCGNLYEELLFRGFLQGYVIERGVAATRAAFIAGTAFAVCHVFLASTVTSVGVPLIVFAWYEGLVVSFLRLRHGVLPAALAHGLAVFCLASGLL